MIKSISYFKKLKWLHLSVLATSVLLLTGCGDEQNAQQAPQMPPPAVSVYNVKQTKVGDYYEYVGRSEAVKTVMIRARVDGFLVKRNFQEGGMVKKGQLLYEIDRAPFQAVLKGAEAQLASSRANLINTEKNLERSKDLVKRGAISQSDYDLKVSQSAQAAAAVEAAKASLQTARLNLGYTRIKAPFDGEIGKSTYSVGNLVGPTSQPLATLTSMDPIYVKFQVNERQVVNYLSQKPEVHTEKSTKAHNSAMATKNRFNLTLKLPNGNVYDHPGTFGFANTQVDKTTGTLTLRASFPNPQGMILPGLYVTLQAESKEKTPMPVIPQSAVQQNQSGYFVLLVNKDNTVESRTVTLGRRIDAMWAVKSGLHDGDRIIVQGLQKARAGAKVTSNAVTVDSVTGAIAAPASEQPKQGQ